jgi:maleate isomerase
MHLESTKETGLTKDALLDMEIQAIEGVVPELAHAQVDVIVYGCTSGSFVGGPGADRKIADLISLNSGVPSTTTSTAVLAALKALNVRKIALGTPYDDVLTTLGKDFLEAAGYEVVNVIALNNVLDLRDAPPELPYELARNVNTDFSECIFISCTQFPALLAIGDLERELNKPVFSSNSASFWHALRILKVKADLSQYGALFNEG